MTVKYENFHPEKSWQSKEHKNNKITPKNVSHKGLQSVTDVLQHPVWFIISTSNISGWPLVFDGTPRHKRTVNGSHAPYTWCRKYIGNRQAAPHPVYALCWFYFCEAQARIGKGWPLRRKALKLKPLPRAYTKVSWSPLPKPPPPTHPPLEVPLLG